MLQREFPQQQNFVVEIANKAISDKPCTRLNYKPDKHMLIKLLNPLIDVFSKANI